MSIAALFDIHGNLPALEAVLADVALTAPDAIVIGGDVLPGPMPAETLRRLLALRPPVHFIHGNGELAALAQIAAGETGKVSYWGTTSGRPLPEELRDGYRWTARQITPDLEAVIAAWPKTVQLRIDGLGQVLFCHATPRSETDIFTRQTAVSTLRPVFDGLGVDVAVCGHTHMQFDRRVGGTRVVNAGSIGEPFGQPGAYWALLGPDVQLRRTLYDFEAAARQFRATAYPQADDSARGILQPPAEADMLALFDKAELK